MNNLISELKQEHQEITSLLLELRRTGLSSDKGVELLMKSKTALLDHLSKEDEQLYPPLRIKAQSELFFKNTLDVFGSEMEKITEFVLYYYQKYSNQNNRGSSDFVKDTARLIVALKDRILKEEISLYKAYEKLNLN